VIRYFKLEGHSAVPSDSYWGADVQSRRVDLTTLPNGKRVSTVFLSLDHSWDEDGPPMIFETMLFSDGDEDMERCSTWEQAEAQHKAMCEKWGSK
jgi:hypothetical protein